ncbi:MAG: OmpA family protein [Lysobacteraceae bacterium]
MSPNADRTLRLLCLSSLAALCLAACGRGGPATDGTGSGSATDTAPTGPANVLPPEQPDFDAVTVPESTATLPPFPFFKAPDGQVSVLGERDRNADFDREHMIAGNKIVAVEGKVARSMYSLDATDLRRYTAIAFQRNYENAILALGGVKISKTAYTDEVVDAFGGRELLDKHYHGTCAGIDCDNNTYLLRQGDKEYWVQVSTGAIPLHGYIVVLQRQVMKQSVGFLDAAAMKQAIDAHGRVALHINFDVDKATLRPDAQPLLEEINKLLDADPALKLSIEGHSDNSGAAAHNQELSTARARSVLGALVGLGIDPARLQSRGFGQGAPVADNGTEAGRAKNRRVELVKQ